MDILGIDTTLLVTLLLVSTRILAWALIAPPIAMGGVPHTVKVMMSVALGLALTAGARAQAPALELGPLAGAIVAQVLIGAALGFLTRLLFTAVEAAGGFFDLFGGFAMSQSYDPVAATMTTILGRFYKMLCLALIFATNAHLLIFGGFLRTFVVLPLDMTMSFNKLGAALAHGTTEMFLSALQIAGPLILVLFLADVGLGVLNRIAPQLNAFTMSFPVKVGLTLVLVGVGLALLPNIVIGLAERANSLIGSVIG